MLDEAQAIKNADTLNARSCRALKADFQIAMTGTPVENQSTDAWSILEFLLPGYLGTLPRFKRLYGAGREGSSPAQAAALRRLISPFLLRRTKGQVLKELPEKTEEVVHCEATDVQKIAYRGFLRSAEAMRARKDLEAGGKIDYANILALLTRLKQVCDHPRLPDLTTGKVDGIEALKPEDAGKWEAFQEILDESLGSSLKVVVFTQYLGMIDLIARVADQARDRLHRAARRYHGSRRAPPGASTRIRSARSSSAACWPEAWASISPRAASAFTWTAGGIPRAKIRLPTACTASARRAACRSSSCRSRDGGRSHCGDHRI